MSKCVCCGAFVDPGAARCKYCGASMPVERKDTKETSLNHDVPPNHTQTPNQNCDSREMNSAMIAEAAKTAAEAARLAAEAARMAAEATGNAPFTNVFSPNLSSFSGKDSALNIFNSENWQSVWKEKRNSSQALGLILTRTYGLESQETFMSALRDYVNFKAQEGVEYYLLDLSAQSVKWTDIDVEDIVALLREIYTVAIPDYLMIIGDTTVVPNATWDNYADPYDADVTSDLPYITLDTQSPWDGVVYAFDEITQVGRIPAKASNGFKEAIAYFDRVKGFNGYTSINAFACSALVWEATSIVEFAHLRPHLITSPKYTSNPMTALTYNLTLLEKLSEDYNVIAINLHGSDESHVWYGQEGKLSPEAFNKGVLPENNGYILCTEACYGARPQCTDSMVVHSLMNGCMAFVGSSKIAFGMDDGTLYCADVIAQAFTYGMACGLPSGLSFLAALTVLCDHELDEAEIKTLAEFALYGDPSFELIKDTAKKKMKKASTLKMSSVSKDKSRAIMLASCTENNNDRMMKGSKNVVLLKECSTGEQAKMKKMAERVSKASDKYVMEKCATMKNVKPSVYKVVGKDEYRAIYAQVEDGIKKIVAMHLDAEGNMTKVYHSK